MSPRAWTRRVSRVLLALAAGGCEGRPEAEGVASPPLVKHVVLVVEENHNFEGAAGTVAMPFLDSLIERGGLATQYYANTHPSIGNYFMLTTGRIITNDDEFADTVAGDNVARRLTAAGRTWKSYAEDLPSVGYAGDGPGLYARRHNPFSYLADVLGDSTQRRNLVPFSQFAADRSGSHLPDYALIVPNLCHDAHDCGLDSADVWLRTKIGPLVRDSLFLRESLLIVTFDESSNDATHGGGRIVWVVVGAGVKRGYRSSTLYQHASTLRLTLEALGLTTFPGAAAAAPAMGEFFTR